MTATTPAVAGRPTAGLEAAGEAMAAALRWAMRLIDDEWSGTGPDTEGSRALTVIDAALTAWHEAAQAHQAAQRQAADDDEAFRVNEDLGALK